MLKIYAGRMLTSSIDEHETERIIKAAAETLSEGAQRRVEPADRNQDTSLRHVPDIERQRQPDADADADDGHGGVAVSTHQPKHVMNTATE